MAADNEARAVLFLYTLTPLHAGSGALVHGVVDLPIQRDRATGHPLIQASSLKGALKSVCRDQDKQWTEALFGRDPQREDVEDFAGALSFTDARILLFPVRSLKGVFAWTTCPLVIERLSRDLKILGFGDLPPQVPRDGTSVGEPSDLRAGKEGKDIVLEEYKLPVSARAEVTKLGRWLADKALPSDPAWAPFRDLLPRRLAVLEDEWFQHFAETATVVATRVALEPKTKTARPGALWSEEHLSPEGLLYSLAIARPPRGPVGNGAHRGPKEGLEFVGRACSPILQMGGDETTGRGLVALRFLHP